MKKVITEREILELEKKGIRVLIKTQDTIITPLAIDRICSSKFTIIEKEISSEIYFNPDKNSSTDNNKIIIEALQWKILN